MVHWLPSVVLTSVASKKCEAVAFRKPLHSLQDSAEFGRIGKYYATESMLVWDEAAGEYNADATPSFGEDTLEDFFTKAVREGLAGQELGDAAVF